MTCERYWRDGIALVENGEPDPHRATCPDCRRAHDARHELLRVLPQVGAAATGDPQWQAQVWGRIARQRKVRQAVHCAGGALSAACLATLFWWALYHHESQPTKVEYVAGPASAPAPARTLISPQSDDPPVALARIEEAADVPEAPVMEIISGPVAMRSTSARVGDRGRILTRASDEVRVYRARELVLRCAPGVAAAGCTSSPRGLIAETTFATAGEYTLVVITRGAVAPRGSMNKDLAAIVEAGGEFQSSLMSIR